MSVDANDVTAFAAKLGVFDSVLGSEARQTMQQSLDVAEVQIASRTPVNQGTLRAGTSTRILGASLNLTGEVVNPILYGLPVEEGRKPGKMPPVSAIELWVIRKGIAPRGESRGVAYMIARAIGRRGTKGAYMFRDGFNAALPTIKKLWSDLPGRVVRRLTG